MIGAATILMLLGFYVGRRTLACVALAGLLLPVYWILGMLLALPFTDFLPREGIAYGVFEITPFALFLKLVFIAVTALVVLASPPAVTSPRNQGEYYSLLLFSTVGMMIVASSRDLLMLFLGLELSSFASYILAGFAKRDPQSAEAAMKYFVIGALSSAMILFAISILYALAGSVEFRAVGQAVVGLAAAGPNPILVFATIFLLAGFGFKIAVFPFHMWAPDVYEGSPTTISAFLAAGSKKMGFAALFKVFLVGLLAAKASWIFVVAVIAILTMTIGNVLALRQDNIKRMLAYSSIAHAGYILIALPVASAAAGTDAGLTQYGLMGGVFHVLTHAFMTAGAFLVVAGLTICGISEAIPDFRGLSKRAPLIAFAMVVFLISFAGLPPLAGFYSKFALFSSAVDAGLNVPGYDWLIWLAVAGVLNSALSLYYYARVVRMMYIEEPVTTERLRVPSSVTAAVTVAMLATILIGLWPDPVVDLSMQAAGSLVAP